MNTSERLLDVLDTFDLENRALTVAEIAARVGQPSSSVYRSVRALKEAGYLGASDDGVYRLQPKVLRLAAVVRADNDLLTVAREPMRRLARELRETVFLAVVSDHHAVALDIVNSGRGIGVTVPPGKLFPLHAGATGRALLANLADDDRRRLYAEHPPERFTDETTADVDRLEEELAEVRSRGYDFTAHQYEPGIYSCAVPVFDEDEQVVASLSVVGVAEALDRDTGVDELLPELRRAAARIQEQL